MAYGQGNYGADYYSATIDTMSPASIGAASSDLSAGRVIHVGSAQPVAATSAMSAHNAFRIAYGAFSIAAHAALSAVCRLFWEPDAESNDTWTPESTGADPWTPEASSSSPWS